MNLEEYTTTGRARYARLAERVAGLLRQAIADRPGYRLLQIQSRAKTPESLRRRLEDIGELDTEEIEAHRKDLAGCRIVFYTNNDVNRFTNSGLLRELFDVDWERSRFHQPGPDERSPQRLFQSLNYVLKLNADRAALPEHREFEGLYCEVQIQTSLNHAWAEMAHDTIYKRPDLKGFGSVQLARIESKLEDAMRKYILRAGYLFQRIATDVDRLAEGKALFDEGALDAALAAANNNDRYEALEQLKNHVLPHYDDLPDVFPEIRDSLKRTWLAACATETVPHETPFGDFRGTEPPRITALIAEIIGQYRYIGPDENYAFVRDLYVRTSDPQSRDQLVKLAKRLAKPDVQVWKRLGPAVQAQLAEALSNEPDIAPIAPLATAIAREILSPDLTGATWSSSAVTLALGTVPYSQALQAARTAVVGVFSRYAQGVIEDEDALRSAATTLFESGRWPHRGALRPQAAIMLFSNLGQAVECMMRVAPQASLNARQDIESMLFRRWRFMRTLPGDLAAEPEVVEAHGRLIGHMTALRDALNADEEFVVFKTIVGFRSVFPHQWDEETDDLGRNVDLRNRRQDELADTITLENWPVWTARLATAARIRSNDGATRPPYRRFLAAIATRRPWLAFELLVDRRILPAWTIPPLACALLEGESRDEVEQVLAQWTDDGRFLAETATVAASAADTVPALLAKVTSRAVNEADEETCTLLILEAVRRCPDNPPLWRDEIYFPCLRVLHRAGNRDWVHRSWPEAGEHALFTSLNAAQSRAVLAAMVEVSHIDYPAEQILTSIASSRHRAVLDWFVQRIRIARQEPPPGFDSIPYRFQYLRQALQPHPLDVLASVRPWVDPDDYAATLDATHFLSKVYPEFQEPLPATLLDSVQCANTDDLAFLASVLHGFNGRQEVFPICRAILASDSATDDTEGHVSQVLSESGLMRGEFGRARMYEEKVERLEPWLGDKNQRVAAFAAREIRHFQNLLALENRRAQEAIAMRKLEYDEPLEGDDASPQNGNSPDDGPV